MAAEPPVRGGPGSAPPGAPLGRAAFLATVAAGLGGIVLAPHVAGRVNGVLGSVADLLPGRLQAIVPTTGWRIYAIASPMPTFDPATYRLRIGGLVERPTVLTWREVADLPGEEQVSDFHCVTGWSVPKVHWEGVRARTIDELVRPLPTARVVTFVSRERPYDDQLDLDQWRAEDTMLARRMDGKPLTREHGAPLRVVMPQMYGYKNVKWVGELRYDSVSDNGFWEQRGYDRNAWVGRSNGYGV